MNVLHDRNAVFACRFGLFAAFFVEAAPIPRKDKESWFWTGFQLSASVFSKLHHGHMAETWSVLWNLWRGTTASSGWNPSKPAGQPGRQGGTVQGMKSRTFLCSSSSLAFRLFPYQIDGIILLWHCTQWVKLWLFWKMLKIVWPVPQWKQWRNPEQQLCDGVPPDDRNSERPFQEHGECLWSELSMSSFTGSGCAPWHNLSVGPGNRSSF